MLNLLPLDRAAQADSRTSSHVVTLEDMPLTVHRYEPPQCEPKRLLFVFAGYGRNAQGYLKRARKLADKACLTVYAPDFDRERFPRQRYQRAGVSGNSASFDSCIGRIVRQLISWGHDREQLPERDYLLFGHSAGGQMLSRVSAYCPPEHAGRIIIANPSAYVSPNLFDTAPYGFGSITNVLEREQRLRDYLSLPITIYLGSEDKGTKRLATDANAQRQGATRVERGLAVYDAGRRVAAQRDWPFNWSLVIADGVGHSSRGMLQARELRRSITKP